MLFYDIGIGANIMKGEDRADLIMLDAYELNLFDDEFNETRLSTNLSGGIMIGTPTFKLEIRPAYRMISDVDYTVGRFTLNIGVAFSR